MVDLGKMPIPTPPLLFQTCPKIRTDALCSLDLRHATSPYRVICVSDVQEKNPVFLQYASHSVHHVGHHFDVFGHCFFVTDLARNIIVT